VIVKQISPYKYGLYGVCAALTKLTGQGCCQSCSDDMATGYGGEIEIESPELTFVARVCCAHSLMEPGDFGMRPEFGPARRTWWAILVRKIRQEDFDKRHQVR
jgi:hypothetical protein